MRTRERECSHRDYSGRFGIKRGTSDLWAQGASFHSEDIRPAKRGDESLSERGKMTEKGRGRHFGLRLNSRPGGAVYPTCIPHHVESDSDRQLLRKRRIYALRLTSVLLFASLLFGYMSTASIIWIHMLLGLGAGLGAQLREEPVDVGL